MADFFDFYDGTFEIQVSKKKNVHVDVRKNSVDIAIDDGQETMWFNMNEETWKELVKRVNKQFRAKNINC